MLIYMLLCNILYIPIIDSNAITKPKDLIKTPNATNKTMLNETNLRIVSEGGLLLPSSPSMVLPNENLKNLMALEEEQEKTERKGIVPRKEANEEINEQVQNNNHVGYNDSKIDKVVPNNEKITKIIVDKGIVNNTSIKTSNTSESNVIHKKPLVLSFDALSKMDMGSQGDQTKLPVLSSSSKSLDAQIPSPEMDVNAVKKYQTKAESHPKLVIPIVITILVLPMFAIVGYIVLKKGKEAWKNRHYKRMDFLLDGMYND